LPIGLVFAVPIIINLSAGWYKRADMWSRAHVSNSGTTVIVIAVLLIAVFVAIFYRRHKWDMYEQQYLEIKAKIQAEKPSF
jgi:membrane protein YdbS with pleckstrin-like domain